jgi:hypothetical protein
MTRGTIKGVTMKIQLLSGLLALALASSAYAETLQYEKVMAPGMWHRINDGMPIVDPSIPQGGAYIVLSDDHHGRASFQVALVRDDDIMKSLTAFQKTTGITSGKGQAVFNIKGTGLDQWVKPVNGANHVKSVAENSREGLMLCLFSGATKGALASVPPPHCHLMVAGVDAVSLGEVVPNADGSPASGGDKVPALGFPAVGGHLDDATVNVVLEMQVDSYSTVLEKESGGDELGGLILSVSEKQAAAAKRLLERLPNVSATAQ